MQGKLVGKGRRAPLSPEAFEKVIKKCKFTNGADIQTVIGLYTKTAKDLLGSVDELKYDGLSAWDDEDYKRLGDALRYCGVLQKLELRNMILSDRSASLVFHGQPLPSLHDLTLHGCRKLTMLPKGFSHALPKLLTLSLIECRSLTSLPDLSALSELKKLILRGCSALERTNAVHDKPVFDLSGLAALRELDLWNCSSLPQSIGSPETLKLPKCTELKVHYPAHLTNMHDEAEPAEPATWAEPMAEP